MKQTSPQLTRNIATTLSRHSYKICTAESCTGGLIAKTFTDLAGSSDWFDRGFVTYSNEAKIDMLGVSSSSLNKYGAVSEEVAKEMVTGALSHSQSQVAISVTGIAGPGGGSEIKPVGTVCFGFALKQKSGKVRIVVERQWFEGDRTQVRDASLYFAISRIESLLTSELN